MCLDAGASLDKLMDWTIKILEGKTSDKNLSNFYLKISIQKEELGELDMQRAKYLE